MSATSWLLSKIGQRDTKKYEAMVASIAEQYGVSHARVKLDMYWNVLTRGAGFTDYFRGNYFGATKEKRDTYVTTKSFYQLLEYLNDESYANVMRNKILFCDVFRPYLGRDFLNLRVATKEEFIAFAAGKDAVFAKKETGFGGHGVSRVDLTEHATGGGVVSGIRCAD